MSLGADSGFSSGFNVGFGLFPTFTSRTQLPVDTYWPLETPLALRQSLNDTLGRILQQVNWNTRSVMSLKSSQAALAEVVLVDSSASQVTVTLLSATLAGAYIMSIKKIDGGNSVKIAAQSGQTIDGTAVQSISAVNGVITIACDGRTWHKISTM